MAKFFEANKSFVDYITMIGFEKKHVDSEKDYYVNFKGNQIRIDYSINEIALINKHGDLIDYSTTFSIEQIDNFSVREGN